MSKVFYRVVALGIAICAFVSAAPSALASNGGPGFP